MPAEYGFPRHGAAAPVAWMDKAGGTALGCLNHASAHGATVASGAIVLDSRKKLMSAFSLLLNLLWIAFGGLWMAVGWAIAAVIMAITIIGLPWARAAFNIAIYTLLPFGQKAVSRAEYTGTEDLGTGPLGLIGNIIWFVLAGWWLALGHLITAILLAVTIIGIPFAWAHLKLAGIALWPIGKIIVPSDEASLSRWP
jgi:uncharacterized membrane protein YccF (DUF307 family)